MRGMDTRDEVRPLHQLVHSNLDKSGSNVIVAGGGAIAISSAPVRGHRLEDPKQGRGTSKPRQGSQPNKRSINERGNAEGAWGEGGPSIIILTLFAG